MWVMCRVRKGLKTHDVLGCYITHSTHSDTYTTADSTQAEFIYFIDLPDLYARFTPEQCKEYIGACSGVGPDEYFRRKAEKADKARSEWQKGFLAGKSSWTWDQS